MALSHKDWKLPNSRIWLAEMDVDRGLPSRPASRRVMVWSDIDYFHLTIFISVSAKELMRKKSKEDEKTLEELNSAHRRSQQNFG